MVSVLTVAFFAEAALTNPCGNIQISSCCTQGVLGPTMIVWDCGCSPITGCSPPPRGGVSPCIRMRSTFEAGVRKSIARVYVLLTNFGQGELGLYACPSTKSKPVAENSTVFSVSTPSAFDASARTALASCAADTPTNAVNNVANVKWPMRRVCITTSLMVQLKPDTA